jgi:hypothetical protein
MTRDEILRDLYLVEMRLHRLSHALLLEREKLSHDLLVLARLVRESATVAQQRLK